MFSSPVARSAATAATVAAPATSSSSAATTSSQFSGIGSTAATREITAATITSSSSAVAPWSTMFLNTTATTSNTTMTNRRNRRKPQDVMKYILILCFLALVSLTVRQVPHLQSVLDRASAVSGANNDFPLPSSLQFHSSSSSSTSSYFYSVEQQQQQKQQNQQHRKQKQQQQQQRQQSEKQKRKNRKEQLSILSIETETGAATETTLSSTSGGETREKALDDTSSLLRLSSTSSTNTLSTINTNTTTETKKSSTTTRAESVNPKAKIEKDANEEQRNHTTIQNHQHRLKRTHEKQHEEKNHTPPSPQKIVKTSKMAAAAKATTRTKSAAQLEDGFQEQTCLHPKSVNIEQPFSIPLSRMTLRQPTPKRCGFLQRRQYWLLPQQQQQTAGATAQQEKQQQKTKRSHQQTEMHSPSFSSSLTHEIYRHQHSCSSSKTRQHQQPELYRRDKKDDYPLLPPPAATYHMDNSFGLGSHLYVWSQALCNAMEAGYRIQTYNPDWLWRDQEYCSATATTNSSNNNNSTSQNYDNPLISPFLCYFPRAEQLCGESEWLNSNNNQMDRNSSGSLLINKKKSSPSSLTLAPNITKSSDQDKKQRKEEKRDVLLEKETYFAYNLSDPKKNRYRCSRIRKGGDEALKEFRAASIEFLFYQSLNPLLIQEAERQVGLLFDDNQNEDDDEQQLRTHQDQNKQQEHDDNSKQSEIPHIASVDVDNQNDSKKKKGNSSLLQPPSSLSHASFVTVPNGLIVVHMRWGDKFWEMKLATAEEYVDAVRELLRLQQEEKQKGQQQQQQKEFDINSTTFIDPAAAKEMPANIFLATEDPKAVENFRAAAPGNWKIYVDRTIAELDILRPKKGNRASYLTKNTKGRAGLVALGSLLVSLEANYFVLTTASNWSRLINDLRKNVLDPRCGNCTRMIDLRPGQW